MSARDGLRRAGRGAASIGTVVVAALIPKCPICIAAMLSALGVGASVGWSVAPIVRPLGILLAIVALALFARAEWQRRRGTPCAGACAKGDKTLSA